MKTFLSILVVIGTICGLFYVVPLIVKAFEQPIPDPQKAIGTIIGYERPTQLKAPYLGVYKFTVNNKEFFIRRSFLTSYILGDSFLVIYSRANPDENSLYLDIPVFERKESVDTVSGHIIHVKRSFGELIVYRFKADGKWFERSQSINASILDQLDKRNTKEVQVIYLLKDPRRSLVIWQGQPQIM